MWYLFVIQKAKSQVESTDCESRSAVHQTNPTTKSKQTISFLSLKLRVFAKQQIKTTFN